MNWWGIGQQDALRRVQEELNYGHLHSWGRRAVATGNNPMRAFERSSRPIPQSYWESASVHPLNSFHITSAIPQTVGSENGANQKDFYEYTGVTLNRREVEQLWPLVSWWRRILADIGYIERRDYWGRALDRNYQVKFGLHGDVDAPPECATSAVVPRAWERLSDSAKAKMSLALAGGRSYSVNIYALPASDCDELANDFADFFRRLRWTVRRAPLNSPLPTGCQFHPGIQVAALSETSAYKDAIKDIKRVSGAESLVSALVSAGFPASYVECGGTINDLTVHLIVGRK